jgi:hypothetical protein
MLLQNKLENINTENNDKVGFNTLHIISNKKFIQNMNIIIDYYRSTKGKQKHNQALEFYYEPQRRERL